MSAKTWFDMSDVLLRSGRITGIQRVVYEIAMRYDRDYKSEIGFFYFDMPTGSFVQCDMPHPGESKPAAGTAVSSPESNGKQQLKRAVRLATPPVVWKLRERASKARQQTVDTTAQAGGNDLFASGDRVVVLGGNWDKPGYFSHLLEATSGKSIPIHHVIFDLICIYDKGHVSAEEHERFPAYIREILAVCPKIFVISDHVGKQVQRFIDEEGITNHPEIIRMRLGDDVGRKVEPSRPVQLPEGADKFMLAVGTVEIRKNHLLLYYTLKRAKELGIKLPHLVIVGRVGWMSEEVRFMFAHDPDISGGVTLMHDTSDAELTWLYDHSLFTLFPSFSEGWGLPVAESISRGRFCIASNSTSIPEIAGDLIDYHSPYSAEECLDKIKKYALDEKLLAEKTEALKSYKTWTWEQTYEQFKKDLDRD